MSADFENFVIFPEEPGRQHKYRVVFKPGRKPEGGKKTVRFGHQKYEHFRDATTLGAWSHKDHNDTKRRELYYARHGKMKTKDGHYAIDVYGTPAWFSARYLWPR